jgi:phasin family protein
LASISAMSTSKARPPSTIGRLLARTSRRRGKILKWPNSTLAKSTEDFFAFGQANVEAFVKSGQIWAAGVQELTKLFATTTKASFDESVATFKAISSAKSVTEAIDLQSTFATSVVEKALAESNKLINTSIKLTEQTLAPITARMTVAADTFGKAA